MRNKLVLAILILCCSLTHVVLAQEFGDEGETGSYGYTSIYYDPSTNVVTAYSETELYGGSNYYYDNVVELCVKGCVYYSEVFGSMPGRPAYTSFSFQGSPGTTYTAEGTHFVQLAQKYRGLTNNDFYGQEEWASYDILDVANYPFTAFAPDTYTENGNDISLGSTYDTATVSLPSTCSDPNLTKLIQEYVSVSGYPGFRPPYTPQCSEFTQTLTDPNFTFTQLNQGNDTWAILRSYFISNMDALKRITPLTLVSSYRNPAKEAITAGGGYAGSRRIYGDAVDVATNQGNWQNYQSYGHQVKACVEPSLLQKNSSGGQYGHAHFDWRTQATVGPTVGSRCPNMWSARW